MDDSYRYFLLLFFLMSNLTCTYFYIWCKHIEHKKGMNVTKEQIEELSYLLEEARKIRMTEAQIHEQRESFAYGNTAFENPVITKEMVSEEAIKLAAK